MNIAVRCRTLVALIILVCISVDGRTRGRRQREISVRQPKRVICQYANWATKRPAEFRFTPKNIDPTICTHIVYNYARLELTQGIVPYDSKADIVEGGWEDIVGLRKINPQAHILLSVGGLYEGSSRFTRMTADYASRKTFVDSAVRLLEQYNFDGLDITWCYPNFSIGSANADKQNYVSLIKALKEKFNGKYLLTISVPALKQQIDSGFDIPELVKYVDYISVQAYGYYDSTDVTVNHHASLYSSPDDLDKDTNVDATIRYYIKRGAHPSMLNLVIPLYGVAFQLEDAEKNEIGSYTDEEEESLEEPGSLIYAELCQRIRKESWTVRNVNSSLMGPYAFKNKLWVAYDDVHMAKKKARYALDMGLGGISFYTVDQDDFKGLCHLSNFPLVRAGRDTFLAHGDDIEFTTSLEYESSITSLTANQVLPTRPTFSVTSSPSTASVPVTSTQVLPTKTSIPLTSTEVLPTKTSVPLTSTQVLSTRTSLPLTANQVFSTITSVPQTSTEVHTTRASISTTLPVTTPLTSSTTIYAPKITTFRPPFTWKPKTKPTEAIYSTTTRKATTTSTTEAPTTTTTSTTEISTTALKETSKAPHEQTTTAPSSTTIMTSTTKLKYFPPRHKKNQNSWISFDEDFFLRPERIVDHINKMYSSNRDIIFSNIEIRIQNYRKMPSTF